MINRLMNLFKANVSTNALLIEDGVPAMGYPNAENVEVLVAESVAPSNWPKVDQPALYHSLVSNRAYIQYPDGKVIMFYNNKWTDCDYFTDMKHFTPLDQKLRNAQFIDYIE